MMSERERAIQLRVSRHPARSPSPSSSAMAVAPSSPARQRRDRAKVNEAVAEAERAKAESSDDAVYDDRHYVQCRWCGKWINGSDPARVAEHRGPLPHPIAPGTEWSDDDDLMPFRQRLHLLMIAEREVPRRRPPSGALLVFVASSRINPQRGHSG